MLKDLLLCHHGLKNSEETKNSINPLQSGFFFLLMTRGENMHIFEKRKKDEENYQTYCEEVIEKLKKFASEDDNIEALYLVGSRAGKENSDKYSDFDVVFVVENTKKMIKNKSWIQTFGKVMIMQEPDNVKIFGGQDNSANQYHFLVQYKEGHRIDFNFVTMSYLKENDMKEEPFTVLLDKKGLLKKLKAKDFWKSKKPTKKDYLACCNEFWWVSLYVLKGYFRKQELFCLEHIDKVLRPELMKMVDYYVTLSSQDKISTGKNHKFLKNHLSEMQYTLILKTYNSGNLRGIYRSYLALCKAFVYFSEQVALLLGIDTYPVPSFD